MGCTSIEVSGCVCPITPPALNRKDYTFSGVMAGCGAMYVATSEKDNRDTALLYDEELTLGRQCRSVLKMLSRWLLLNWE